MYEYKAIVDRWIDGDTLVVRVDLGFYVRIIQKLRLARINTPEMDAKVPYQVRRAKHARAVARKFCPEGSSVTIITTKNRKDRYLPAGRQVLDILPKWFTKKLTSLIIC